MATYSDILQSVTNKMTDLHLVNTTVAKRKLPDIGEELDTLPMLFVVASDRPERIRDCSYEDDQEVEYAVQVVYATGSNKDSESGLDEVLAIRERIRKALQGGSLQGVQSVWDVSLDPDAAFDRDKFNQNYDYSSLTFLFKVNENMN